MKRRIRPELKRWWDNSLRVRAAWRQRVVLSLSMCIGGSMRFTATIPRATLRTGILLALAAVAAPAAAQTDIVLSPAAPSARAGNWSVVSDSTAAGGQAIRHP